MAYRLTGFSQLSVKQSFARLERLKAFSSQSIRADVFAHIGPIVVSVRKWPREEMSINFPFESLSLSLVSRVLQSWLTTP